MAKNMIKTSYNKAFGIVGICAVFAIALLSVTPVAHAYSYGGGTYMNGGNRHYDGGSYNYGDNYNYGGHDGRDYRNYNYGGTYSSNYSYNSTPTVIYQPVQTYYEPAQTYYDYEPAQTYYEPEQTYYQPQVAIDYQTAPQYAVAQYPVVQSNTASGLDISCSVDSSTATINQPVTWTATVTGGAAPYTYSWSGSDGISGSQSSIIKYYGSSGYKVAAVTITSADGLTGTQTCENAVTVRNPGSARTYARPTNTPASQPAANGNPNAAAAGLIGIPWGWIALLVILALVITIVYLLFTEPKKI